MTTQDLDALFWGTGGGEGAAVSTTKAVTTRESGAGRLQVQGMPFGRWMVTTPGRLRVASIALVAVLVLVGVAAALATESRRDATHTVAQQATPELVAAESLFAALADADAAASTAYLQPGVDSVDLRHRYDDDIEVAGRHLTLVAGAAGTSPKARHAVRVISQQMPVYTGLVEAARANDRQGNSVSSAYLRDASRVMREDILPQATIVYEHAAHQLDDAYRSGTSSTDILLVAGVGIVALALLVALQLYLFTRMHRMVNAGLAGATAILLVLLVWTLVAFGSQQSDLVSAQRHGSDAVQILSAARILALRAHSDDNLALIERGGGEKYLVDYDELAGRIADNNGRGGLLDVAGEIAARSGSRKPIVRLREHYAAVAAAHRAVRNADDTGDYEKAVRVANEEKVPAVATFDRDLRIEIARARVELDQRATDARSGFGVLLFVIPVLTVGGALLVLVGLQRRIGEYR
jgi:hypothetical protein